jgi:acetoacetyl-CoA synthetase
MHENHDESASGRGTPERALLWEPGTAIRENARITAYMDWLARDGGPHLTSYGELWRWSVQDTEAFWESLWRYFPAVGDRGWGPATEGDGLPGLRWFPQTSLNYTRRLAHHAREQPDTPALIAYSEQGPQTSLTYRQLQAATDRAAQGLTDLGVGREDVVAAYLPNVAEAVIAMLAVARIGAVWSACPPHLDGATAAQRFAPLKPSVLLTVDSFREEGTLWDLSVTVDMIRSSLPSLSATVQIPTEEGPLLPGAVPWSQLGAEGGDGLRRPEAVPFDHPLWVLKPPDGPQVVHGHGGIVLEHLKALSLHHDLGPGDVVAWQARPGELSWYYHLGALLVGATAVLYAGSPAFPRTDALFALAESERVTCLGVDSRYLTDCIRSGASPGNRHDLSDLRDLVAFGARLSPQDCAWVYEHVAREVHLGLGAAAPALCTQLAGPVPLLPVRAGVASARFLGARVENGAGGSGSGNPGVVVTRPMPSMPVSVWDDPDADLYRRAFLSRQGQDRRGGAWLQPGDLRILEDGSCVPD